MKKIIALKAQPYGKRLIVCIGTSKEEILRAVKKYKLRTCIKKEILTDKFPSKHDRAVTYLDTERGNALIYLPDFKTDPKYIALLNHEVNHFGVQVMKVVGCNIMKEDEPFCYTTEELIEKILKKIW